MDESENKASKSRQIIRWSKLKQPDIKLLKCLICQYQNELSTFKMIKANDIFNCGEIIRYQCPECDVIFGDLRVLLMDSDELGKDYQDTYSYMQEGDVFNNILNALFHFDYLMNKEWTYLDYACGHNRVIKHLQAEGYQIVGYDKFVPVVDGMIHSLESKKFDVIFSNNFIEHLTNPIEEIKEIITHLNPNGLLVFISDVIDEYTVEYTHFHTFFYLNRSFPLLCRKLNLALINSKNFGNYKMRVLKLIEADEI